MQQASVATVASQELNGRFGGTLVGPDDPTYDESRKVFNGMIDRRPAVIARCARTADVVAAVDFAREHDLPLAVRCGGHSPAGMSVCDDGIVVDLAGLDHIEVDPDARVARAGGGVLWGAFDRATQEHGLHTPGGRVTTTGLGGFTTGGGYGWTSSRYGLTCDNLISAEVVTADGRVLAASETENPDLFWGIRGGSGNFGIVTRFDFRLHALGPIVLAGLAQWPIQRAGEVMRAWRDYMDEAPDELASACVILTAPPLDFVPEHLRGQPVLGLAAMYIGDPDEGARVLQPLKDLGPDLDLIQPMPYTEFQAILDPSAPPGVRDYWRSEYLRGLPDDAIDVFVERGEEQARLAPLTQLIIFRLGGAISRVAEDATAFAHREPPYIFHPISVWEDPADDEALIAANREFCAAVRPFGTGAVYVNWIPEGDRVEDAYGGKYDRLVALKNKYDPENLFRHNQNIAPTHAAA